MSSLIYCLSAGKASGSLEKSAKHWSRELNRYHCTDFDKWAMKIWQNRTCRDTENKTIVNCSLSLHCFWQTLSTSQRNKQENKCPKCKMKEAHLTHCLWSCKIIQNFWSYVANSIMKINGLETLYQKALKIPLWVSWIINRKQKILRKSCN